MGNLLVCQLTFGPGHTFEADVEETARLGIPGITVVGGKVDAFGFKRAKRLVRDAGFKLAGYHASLGWFTLPGDFRQRVEGGKRRIEEAAELEADFLLVKTGPRGEFSWDEARRKHLEGMAEVAPIRPRFVTWTWPWSRPIPSPPGTRSSTRSMTPWTWRGKRRGWASSWMRGTYGGTPGSSRTSRQALTASTTCSSTTTPGQTGRWCSPPEGPGPSPGRA